MKLVTWGIVAALAGAAAPAVAVVSPVATFSPSSGTANVKFVNSANKFGTAKNNGAFGAVKVNFSFLTALLDDLDPITADFTLLATSTDTAHAMGTTRTEGLFTGTFSFISTKAFTTSFGHTYEIGTNLLSGTFSKAQGTGTLNGTTFGFSASTAAGAPITFTSDVLGLSALTAQDFSLSAVAVSPKLGTGAGSKFKDFKATVGGEFSADSALVLNVPVPALGVPEPASWAMMLGGFGLIGGAMRRRRPVLA